MTDTLATDWLPHLREHGYALVPAVLDREKVARLLAALDDAPEATGCGGGRASTPSATCWR